MKRVEAIVINGNQRNSAIPLENESRITLKQSQSFSRTVFFRFGKVISITVKISYHKQILVLPIRCIIFGCCTKALIEDHIYSYYSPDKLEFLFELLFKYSWTDHSKHLLIHSEKLTVFSTCECSCSCGISQQS